MNSGYYAACTGLIARTEALDTIANNLANVGTAGFRGSRNVFSSLLVANSGIAALRTKPGRQRLRRIERHPTRHFARLHGRHRE